MSNAIQYLPLDEFKEAEENPRSIAPDRYDSLKRSLRTQPDMLDARPLIVDARKGDIVAGNMRHRGVADILANDTDEEKAKLQAFIDERGGIPVYMREFDDAERREWMLRDNNEYGDWVPEELAALVALHESEGGDMGMLGFDTGTMSDLLKLANADAPGEPPPDDPPADVWGVVIECDSETQQGELLEEFSERGLEVRALIA